MGWSSSAVRRSWRTAVLVGALASLVLVLPPLGGSTAGAQVPCEDLADLDLPEVVAITAELDTDGEAAGQTGLPEFCRVALTVDPQVNIEVWLPVDGVYNQRFQGVGGGGYAGSISFGGMGRALRDGYATASTDTGHVGGSGAFALNPDGTLNHQLIEDFASRSLFELTNKSKALIDAFYGQPADFTYWNGCSTGGRQGLMQAQRLPDGYDGILAGAPAINWDRFHAAHIWPHLVRLEEVGDEPIDSCKLNAAVEAAVAHCDGLDGVEDGIVDEPRRCDFDPAELVGEIVDCGEFTEADARAIRLVWDGPRDTDGERLWYGIPVGANMGALAGGSNPFFIGLQHAQLWVNQDPDWDWRTLTYDTYEDFFNLSVEKFNDVIGTDDPDLSAFRDNGGKVLIWHGWADPLIFPQGTIDYYDRVLEEMGGERKVKEFARLFMAPGVSHCGGGPGPNQFDMFGTLIDWVEGDEAPDRIIASRVEDGETVRTRPLCAYPDVARWTGSGSTDDADNFECSLRGLDRADHATGYEDGQHGRNNARR